MGNNKYGATKKMRISVRRRSKLVHLVINEGVSLVSSAKRLEIKMCTARIIIDKYKKEGVVFDRTQRKFVAPEILKEQEQKHRPERQELEEESEGRGEKGVKEEEKQDEQQEQVNNPVQIEGRESTPELKIESIKEEDPLFTYYQWFSPQVPHQVPCSFYFVYYS